MFRLPLLRQSLVATGVGSGVALCLSDGDERKQYRDTLIMYRQRCDQ